MHSKPETFNVAAASNKFKDSGSHQQLMNKNRLSSVAVTTECNMSHHFSVIGPKGSVDVNRVDFPQDTAVRKDKFATNASTECKERQCINQKRIKVAKVLKKLSNVQFYDHVQTSQSFSENVVRPSKAAVKTKASTFHHFTKQEIRDPCHNRTQSRLMPIRQTSVAAAIKTEAEQEHHLMRSREKDTSHCYQRRESVVKHVIPAEKHSAIKTCAGFEWAFLDDEDEVCHNIIESKLPEITLNQPFRIMVPSSVSGRLSSIPLQTEVHSQLNYLLSDQARQMSHNTSKLASDTEGGHNYCHDDLIW